MALGSRLRAIDTQIATLIDAGTDSTVTVTRGHPGETIAWEAVWTDEITFDENPAALGKAQQMRRQVVKVPIVVRIRQDGDDFPTLRDRACDVADQVEEVLRDPANLDLSGNVDFGWVESGALDSFKDTDGRVGSVVLIATYTARKG